jgi:aminoglycoside 2'-N-acetyltransferase I
VKTVVAPTADLGDLAPLRAFLEDAFDDYGDHPWDHALGGTHVVVTDGDAIAAHASVIARRLRVGGNWLRAGYVESVAVGAAHRRQGLGERVMGEVNRLIRGGYELGGLAATEDGARLYPRVGWERWQGPQRVLTADGLVDAPDEVVFVLPVTRLDLGGELVADPRDGSAW